LTLFSPIAGWADAELTLIRLNYCGGYMGLGRGDSSFVAKVFTSLVPSRISDGDASQQRFQIEFSPDQAIRLLPAQA
jgi:hypothetical protein